MWSKLHIITKKIKLNMLVHVCDCNEYKMSFLLIPLLALNPGFWVAVSITCWIKDCSFKFTCRKSCLLYNCPLVIASFWSLFLFKTQPLILLFALNFDDILGRDMSAERGGLYLSLIYIVTNITHLFQQTCPCPEYHRNSMQRAILRVVF